MTCIVVFVGFVGLPYKRSERAYANIEHCSSFSVLTVFFIFTASRFAGCHSYRPVNANNKECVHCPAWIDPFIGIRYSSVCFSWKNFHREKNEMNHKCVGLRKTKRTNFIGTLSVSKRNK